jgi:SAM-dependent methyltransferase
MPDLEKISFEVVDLYAISAVSDNYDLIIGTDIIHHLDDPEKVLRELRSKVNPGGKLVILETNIRNPLTWVNVIGREHEMRAVLNTRENLLSWLEGAGWQNASVVPGPAFTPAGPKWAHPALTVIDHVAVRIPKLNQIAAFWTLFGEQHE